MLHILLIAGLVRLLIATDQPLLCAGIYAGALGALGIMVGSPAAGALLALIGFAKGGLFFGGMHVFRDSEALWWITLLCFLLSGFII